MKRQRTITATKDGQNARFRVRLPGFFTSEEIGLGDAISRITYAVGVKPCGGCRERARRLNRWIAFKR